MRLRARTGSIPEALMYITVILIFLNYHIFLKIWILGVSFDSDIGEFVAEVSATDSDEGDNARFQYEIRGSHLFKSGSNESSGSLFPSPFTINAQGKVTTAFSVSAYNQDRFELHVAAVEDNAPHRGATVILHVSDQPHVNVNFWNRQKFENSIFEELQAHFVLEIKMILFWDNLKVNKFHSPFLFWYWVEKKKKKRITFVRFSSTIHFLDTNVNK